MYVYIILASKKRALYSIYTHLCVQSNTAIYEMKRNETLFSQSSPLTCTHTLIINIYTLYLLTRFFFSHVRLFFTKFSTFNGAKHTLNGIHKFNFIFNESNDYLCDVKFKQFCNSIEFGGTELVKQNVPFYLKNIFKPSKSKKNQHNYNEISSIN